MDQANTPQAIEPPQTSQNNPISHKNILFLLFFGLTLIIITASTTHLVLQSRRNSIPMIPPDKPPVIPTSYSPTPDVYTERVEVLTINKF